MDWNSPFMLTVGIPLLKIVILLGVVAFCVAYTVWLERRLLGFFQSRVGPNRVGPAGLIQPIADGLKLILKEDIIPTNARPFLFRIAPIFAVVPAFAGFAIVAFAPPAGPKATFLISDANIGILYLLAITSLGVFGIVLGGWASGSKYPLFGSLRSASQMLSYEVPLTFSVLSVILMAGSFRLDDIIQAQGKLPFLVPLILAFGVYVISAVAETNRAPFDLPEAESELVGGFHTEYSGMRFAFYFLAEYANVVLVCCVATSLFLGGYKIPFLPYETMLAGHPWVTSAVGLAVFAVKAVAFLFFYIWIRATFPRYRYDQLLKIGWKVLLPISLLNLLLVAGIKLAMLR
ncbi:MAG: NADH-quinone oxidoreductase subunit NuoH [Acidobacteriota bacterium]